MQTKVWNIIVQFIISGKYEKKAEYQDIPFFFLRHPPGEVHVWLVCWLLPAYC